MDSTTSDDYLDYLGKLIYKQSSTAKAQASSSVAGAKATIAAWDKKNDDAAAAAECANNSRNLVPNEVIAQTRKSPHLYLLMLLQFCHHCRARLTLESETLK